jgi:hydroxymethylbilane synthase
MRKAEDGLYDAVVLAAAGLRRLGLTFSDDAAIPFNIMLPAPGQGALGVQCRAGDSETLDLLIAIDNSEVRRATTAERHFLQGLGGGCSAPIAAYARSDANGDLAFDGLIASPDGGKVIRVSGTGSDPATLAQHLASQALEQGASAILADIST